MAGIIKHASLTQLYFSEEKMYANCRKYTIGRNSYNSELFYVITVIGSEYTVDKKSVYVSVTKQQSYSDPTTLTTEYVEEDETIDKTLKQIMQEHKVENPTFSCISYTDTYNKNILNKYIQGLFPEFSTIEVQSVAERSNVITTKQELVELISAHEITIDKLKSRALCSTTAIITLLPGIPCGFCIEDIRSTIDLICVNIHKLRKYVS